MSKYRNEALEELLEVEEDEISGCNSFDGCKIRHCSRTQAMNFLYNTGFRGISNKKQLDVLFRFALATYKDGMFIGATLVFLDVVETNCCFAVVSSKNVGICAEMLKKSEEICKIMGVSRIKLSNTGYIPKVIQLIEKDRGLYDRYSEGKGCWTKRIDKD